MTNRTLSFDGLRGVAALAVFLGHFFNDGVIKNLPVINLFTDTKVAVSIFFILSGFVLFNNTNTSSFSLYTLWSLARRSFARFIRLAIPVWGITAIVFVMHPLIRPANDPALYWNLFADIYNFQPVISDIFYYPILDVFIFANFERNYIPPSWTMRPEFVCSVFVYLIPWSKLGQKSWKNVIILFIIASTLIGTYGSLPFFYYLGFFVAGAAVQYLPSKIPYLLHLIILAAVIKTICNYFVVKSFGFDFVFALLIVLLVYQSKTISTVLGSSPFLFLGKISFPLYLIHVPIIALLAPRLSDFVSILNFGGYSTSFFIFMIVSACVLFVSWILTLLDIMAIVISKRIKP